MKLTAPISRKDLEHVGFYGYILGYIFIPEEKHEQSTEDWTGNAWTDRISARDSGVLTRIWGLGWLNMGWGLGINLTVVDISSMADGTSKCNFWAAQE